MSGFFKYIGKKIKGLFYLAFSIASIIIGGVINAEMIVAKEFADTILHNKLDGFLDNILFWAGFKKIEISSSEMLSAMAKIVGSTPKIIKGFVIGGLIGLGIWVIFAEIIGAIARNSKKEKIVERRDL